MRVPKCQRARMRSVAREQRKQQTVRGRIGEHEAIGRIAVLVYEIEKRGEVGRKLQAGSIRQFCPDSFSTTGDRRERLPPTTYKAEVSTYLLDARYGGKADIARICRDAH